MKKSVVRLVLIFTLSMSSITALAAEYLPNIERRDIVTPGIDTENFEFGVFVSLISIQDFSVEPYFGLRMAYHIHENYFVEASMGQTDVGRTAVERLFDGSSGGISNLQTLNDRRYTDYHLSLGWNMLQGQTSFNNTKSMIQNTYLIGGAGITDFAEQSSPTFNLGIGHRLLFNDNLAFRLEGRDYIVSFENPPAGTTKTQHNLALSIGFSLFF